jgi:RNA polymerase sigma factor (sigma-70 family)
MDNSFPTTIWEDIWAAQRGDRGDLNSILLKYRTPILSFLGWKGFSVHEAEDLVQEVLMRVARPEFLEKIDASKGKFRVLLQTVTRHVISEEIRRRKTAKREGGGKALRIHEVSPQAARKEEGVFDRMWIRQILDHALKGLYADSMVRKARHAEAFRLHFIEGKSQEEVARHLGCSLANAKNHIHYARLKYKQLVLQAIRATCSSAEEFEEEVERLSPYLKEREMG